MRLIGLLFAVAHAAAPASGIAATTVPQQSAASYPNKPIRVIVPFAAGGGLEITARLISQKLTEKWGQSFVIDARPGAATVVGTEIASKAAPDGYTLLMITTTFAINPALRRKLPYDTLRDFAPVTQLNSQPNIIVVHPSSPTKSVQDLIALAKAKPGQLTYASPGAGSAPHLSAELFKRTAGIDLIHVPYKGIPPAVTDVIGGRVNMLFTTTISAAPHIKAGTLRALTSAKRLSSMPAVPTVSETIPRYEAEAFQGVVAPAGVPRAIVEKLAAEIGAVVRSREITDRFTLDGAVAVGSTPAEFASFLKSEMLKWDKVVKDARITAD